MKASVRRPTIQYHIVPQSILEQIAQDTSNEELNKAIDNLPNLLADIITLRYYRQRTIDELSAAFNIPKRSVSRYVKDAITRLSVALTKINITK